MSDDKYAGLGLSDEEIAAMEEELEDIEGEDVDADDGGDETPPVAAQDDAGDADEAEGESEAKGEEKAPERPAQEEKKPVQEHEPQPSPEVQRAENALDKLNADMADLKKKFDEGDIAVDEYIDERDRLSRAIVKAELKAELAQESAAKSWEQSQKDFLGNESSSFLRESDVVYDAFAMQVNKLIADPKSASMSDEALLKAARDKVYAAFRISPESQPSKKGESAIREAKKEAADRGKAPKTLQGVPAAAPADDTDANPFAYLDRLSGEKLEAAVEKLSPEDRVRWAHSQ